MINTLATLIKILTTIVYLMTQRRTTTAELFSAGRSIAFAISLLVIVVNSVLSYVAIGY